MQVIPLSSFLSSLALLFGLAAAQCPPSQSDYATVVLPWGTVQATDCDPKLQLYTFSNVRFGKPTNGAPGATNATVRFGPSAPPDNVADPASVMLPSTGARCLQVDPYSGPDCNATGYPPHLGAPLLAPHNSDVPGSEDCLFLDIYVPISAVPPPSGNLQPILPVIVWFYGGSYIFGAKDADLSQGVPLYSGAGLVEAAQSLGESFIFVAGNYRLGQLGWLAGPAMVQQQEKDNSVVLNAGLTDQRLLLQFVQNNIGKFGGDSSRVTAFGESAGAGSILHHLIAQENGTTRDPLFYRAAMQSAAYQWLWDNSAGGPSDKVFGTLVDQTPCNTTSGTDALACLQGLSSDALMTAMSTIWNATKCSHVFNIGPVVDGKVITQLPAVALESADFKFHPKVESVISSHVADEAMIFVPTCIKQNSGFGDLLEAFIPGNSSVPTEQRGCITTAYCGSPDPSSCTDQRASAKAVIQDSMFTCNTRFAYDAAARQGLPVYLMDYAFYQNKDAAIHATDLLPMFWNYNTSVPVVAGKIHQFLPNQNLTAIEAYLTQMSSYVRSKYQRYFVNYAINGVPSNTQNPEPWPTPSLGSGGVLGNVMQVTAGPIKYFHSNYSDPLNTETTCQFWSTIASDVVNGVVPSNCPRLFSPAAEWHDSGEL